MATIASSLRHIKDNPLGVVDRARRNGTVPFFAPSPVFRPKGRHEIHPTPSIASTVIAFSSSAALFSNNRFRSSPGSELYIGFLPER